MKGGGPIVCTRQHRGVHVWKKTQRDDVRQSSIPEKCNPLLDFRRWQPGNISWMYRGVGDLPPLSTPEFFVLKAP